MTDILGGTWGNAERVSEMENKMTDRLRATAAEGEQAFTVTDGLPERFRITQQDEDDMASDVRASLGGYWAATNKAGATEGYRRRDR